MDISTGSALFLVVAAFLAGFVDSIAGGGGLITVPSLLIAGLDPVGALATNKLQGLFSTGSATIAYASKGHVDLRSQAPMAVMAFCGAVLGAFVATVVPDDLLNALLPVLLIAVAVYFLFKRRLDDTDRARRISAFAFGLTFVPLIGFYDGAFGPGAGSFYMLAFVSLAGFGVLRATAHTKLLNFSSNLGGFLAFAFVGVVHWQVGLMMGLASFAGARVGAGLAMRNGARLIRPRLVVVCVALAVKLLADPANPLRLWIAG